MKTARSSIQHRSGRLIAVEGCIGVGKSTWAKALAERRQARLVLEDFEKNPFLREFYEDPRGNALETELSFLLIHYHQLRDIQNRNAPETVTDFAFCKDRIFARMNLVGAEETQAFDHLYDQLVARLRPADMIIYLRGPSELIVNRIEERNREVEMKIDMDYFVRLNQAYDEFFAHYQGAVHLVEADRADCVRHPEVVQEVSKALDEVLALTTNR